MTPTLKSFRSAIVTLSAMDKLYAEPIACLKDRLEYLESMEKIALSWPKKSRKRKK
jgi:hypothetical protein